MMSIAEQCKENTQIYDSQRQMREDNVYASLLETLMRISKRGEKSYTLYHGEYSNEMRKRLVAEGFFVYNAKYADYIFFDKEELDKFKKNENNIFAQVAGVSFGLVIVMFIVLLVAAIICGK